MARTKPGQELEAAGASLVDSVESAATSLAATSSTAIATRAKNATTRRPLRIPVPLQFPLVVVLSFATATLSATFLGAAADNELLTVAKEETRSEVAVTVAWKIFELALGWFGNYDGYDLAALNLLSYGPFLYLLYVFYGISAQTVATRLGISVVSSLVPFFLLRPLSNAHSAASNIPNRDIIQDKSIQGFTTILAGVAYSTTLFIACKLFLPSTFVLYFEGIPSIEPAENATLLGNLPTETLGLAFGLAARLFVFTPVAATPATPDDREVGKFNPETATLGQTLLWNLWGFTARSKVAIKRTLVAMFVTGLRTFLECRTINGVESYGAATYAAIWMAGTLLTGRLLVYVLSV